MSPVPRPANQTAFDSWLTAQHSLFVSVGMIDQIDIISSEPMESHADVIVFPAP